MFLPVFCINDWDIKIDPNKLKSELKSGTSCDEFVLRVTGKSKTKGDDKGKHTPEDVYNILQGKMKSLTESILSEQKWMDFPKYELPKLKDRC